MWDVSQTTGEPIPERPAPAVLDGRAPAGLRDGLVERVLAEGYAFIARPDPARLGSALGMTNFTDRLVLVREGLPDAQQVKTLAHELGHVLLHEPVPDEARAHRGIQEAESVALMVCGAFGMDTSRYSVPYVATWASRMPDRTVMQAVAQTGARVRDAAISLLAGLPAPAWEDGLSPGVTGSAVGSNSTVPGPTQPAAGPPDPPVCRAGCADDSDVSCAARCGRSFRPGAVGSIQRCVGTCVRLHGRGSEAAGARVSCVTPLG